MSKTAELQMNAEEKAYVQRVVENASVSRAELMSRLIDPRRSIDDECGYPKDITVEQYKLMYDREGIATRVVALYPEESWAVDPVIYEDEEPKETEFEKAWVELNKQLQVLTYMAKSDEISGIGRFGVMLLGIGDGKTLDQPVEGIDERGVASGNATHKLLFIRAFDEACVTVKTTEIDVTNPRFGQPLIYSIKFEDAKTTRTDQAGVTSTVTGKDLTVHWSRIVHIADNRKSSEVYGVPRMQTLFNRLYDLRKIAGGSGEMFWKGGFPGYSFEMDPNAKPLTPTQKKDVRDEVIDYANGLQRYLLFQGIKTNSLTPQVADPQSHVEVQLMIIAISIGAPKRIFMGSEQAQLASAQDMKSWNRRLSHRQEKYLTPEIIRPFIDRMIAFGVLPAPVSYDVAWQDLNTLSEKDRADVLKLRVEAYAKYVQGGVDQLIPPNEFMTMIAMMDPEEVKQIMEAALQREKELEVDESETDEDEPAAGAAAE